jgi:Protein of unknown function (DUF3179)
MNDWPSHNHLRPDHASSPGVTSLHLLLRLAFAVAVGVVLLRSPLAAQDRDPDFRPQRVVGSFPPITKFPVKPAREARDALNPTELVIGVTVGKESRAYPVNMLTGPKREILNDTLGGKAIAATW